MTIGEGVGEISGFVARSETVARNGRSLYPTISLNVLYRKRGGNAACRVVYCVFILYSTQE
jgi:hypothetical protein